MSGVKSWQSTQTSIHQTLCYQLQCWGHSPRGHHWSISAIFFDCHHYAVSFLDDQSRFLFFGMTQRKSDLADVYAGVCNQLRNAGFNVGRVHSDCAKEYVSLQIAFWGERVEKTFPSPYTPEHNKIAKRVNCTITKASRSLLIQANFPSSFWPSAVKHVLYVRSCIPYSAIKSTAFEIIHGTKSSLKNTKDF